jgi:hypothetical protein
VNVHYPQIHPTVSVALTCAQCAMTCTLVPAGRCWKTVGTRAGSTLPWGFSPQKLVRKYKHNCETCLRVRKTQLEAQAQSDAGWIVAIAQVHSLQAASCTARPGGRGTLSVMRPPACSSGANSFSASHKV